MVANTIPNMRSVKGTGKLVKQMKVNENIIITLGGCILASMIILFAFGCDENDNPEPDAGRSCITHLNERCPDAGE
jgi:hypothetical protein